MARSDSPHHRSNQYSLVNLDRNWLPFIATLINLYSYYLDFSASLKQWHMTLYRGDSAAGVKVLTMACKPLKRAKFEIQMISTGWKTELEKPRNSPIVSVALSFHGFKEASEPYIWTSDDGWKIRWTVR